MYFCYFVFISPWKRAWPFIWTNLNPLYPRMFRAPCGSWEEDENVKILQIDGRTHRRKDDERQAIRKTHFSFQLKWAKIKGAVFIPFTIRKETKQQHNLLKTCWERNVYFNNSIFWLNISFLLQFCMLKIHSFWKTNTVHCLSLSLRYSSNKVIYASAWMFCTWWWKSHD